MTIPQNKLALLLHFALPCKSLLHGKYDRRIRINLGAKFLEENDIILLEASGLPLFPLCQLPRVRHHGQHGGEDEAKGSVKHVAVLWQFYER